MLKLLIEKELKEILGSTKFVFTFAVCSILILLTFYVGARNYQINKSQHEASVAENMKTIQELTTWKTAVPKISIPPMPLASLISGVSNDIGRNIDISGKGELKAVDSKYNEDLIYAVFRFLDLDFLFQIILSLFAILFTYNAINGEKERGTLALTFANSIPRDKFITGKIIGSFLALAVPLLIPLLLGSLLLPMLGVPMHGEDWLKLILVIGTGLLYFGVFLCLSVFMSIVMKQSSSSFLLMLVIWIMSVIIVPRASVALSGRAFNVPSADELNSKKTKYGMSLAEEFVKKIMQMQKDNPQGIMSELPKLIDDMAQKNLDFANKLNEERSNKQSIQQAVALNIARISPSACFSLASGNIAGTSLNLVDDYMAQASNYRNVFKKFQDEKIKIEGGSILDAYFAQKSQTKIDSKELPLFAFKPASFGGYFSKIIIDIALLIIYNMIFFICSFVAFIKYDLR